METKMRNVRNSTNENKFASSIFVHQHLELIMAIISGVILLFAWIFTPHLPHSIWIILHIIAFLIGGYHKGKEGILDTIQNKELNVELLMVIAAIGAASIGYWTEGAVLIFIFAFAGALETYSKNKSESELSSLMKMQPEEAQLRLEDGTIKVISVKELEIGDMIYVRAGERIPADGLIRKGTSSIDESAITGESIPVTKNIADEALDGTIEIEITKRAGETTFQKIINMVQSAKDEKTPAQQFIEKFEGTYVKTVLAVVILMMFLPYLFLDWTLTESIYRAMILLVVASPCALVASITPAALSTISNNARNGVLLKGAIHAEMLSKINVMAFDKTGTITNGTPVVTDFHVNPQEDREQVLYISGAIERESTHPLAVAIVKYSESLLHNKKVDRNEISNIKTESGKGIIGTFNGDIWHLGKEYLSNHKDNHVFEKIAATLSNEGKTVVFVARNKKIVAIFALKDTVRKEAKLAIQVLKNNGIETMMLTGDNERTAQAVALEVGLDHYTAECLPDHKVKKLKSILAQNKRVAMIGDGINDAPALAIADIGIAMGGGTDVALETADMVLMNDDLTHISNAVTLSKKMNRIIKQNIYFSLAVICLLILSNFLQLIDLPFGVIGHEGSTILVILNGLRMLRG